MLASLKSLFAEMAATLEMLNGLSLFDISRSSHFCDQQPATSETIFTVMFPLTVTGSMPVQGADPEEAAASLTEILREVGMRDVQQTGTRITFRRGSEPISRSLGTISRGELVVEPGPRSMQASYILYFHQAVAFATMAVVAFLAFIFASNGPKAGPALFVMFVGFPWMTAGAALTGKVAFEDWMVRCGPSRDATPRQIVAAHKKKTIELQTIAVIAGICAVILIAMLVLLLAWLSRR